MATVTYYRSAARIILIVISRKERKRSIVGLGLVSWEKSLEVWGKTRGLEVKWEVGACGFKRVY